MRIFNEIYGTYFRIVGKLTSMERFTRSDVYDIIGKYGFSETGRYLRKYIFPQNDGSDWELFKENEDGTFSTKIKGCPRNILTNLQKCWIAAKLMDPKMRLFLDEKDIRDMGIAIGNAVPLYSSRHFRYVDGFSDGDDYSDERYIRNFRAVLSAIKDEKMIKIKYITEKKEMKFYRCQPLKLEYSRKNDKFRLHCRVMYHNRFKGNTTINLSRILSVKNFDAVQAKKADMVKYYSKRRASESVEVRIKDERNGVERFLAEFAAYEKQTVRDLETGICTTKITYDKADETELLIQLLSFGAVIEIVGPPHFRQLVAERVKRQYKLAFGDKENLDGSSENY